MPHYGAKGAVAAHIGMLRSHEMMRKESDGWYNEHVMVLTTAPYYENFQLRLVVQTAPVGRPGRGDVRHSDGRWPVSADRARRHRVVRSPRGRDMAVIGDSLTGAQMARAFEPVTGTPVEYLPVPREVVRSSMPEFGHDFPAMFEFFQTP